MFFFLSYVSYFLRSFSLVPVAAFAWAPDSLQLCRLCGSLSVSQARCPLSRYLATHSTTPASSHTDNPLGRHTPEDTQRCHFCDKAEEKKVEPKGVFILIALYFTCNLEMEPEQRDSKSEILLIHPDKLTLSTVLPVGIFSVGIKTGSDCGELAWNTHTGKQRKNWQRVWA